MSSRFPPPINYATKPKTQKLPAAPRLPDRRKNGTSTDRQAETNVFELPIDTAAPSFPVRSHTLQVQSALNCLESGRPIPTQRFYANLLLGSQKSQIYPLPYVLRWSGDSLDINHADEHQRVFGPDPGASDAQYYFCPVGIVSLRFSAREGISILETSKHDQFSVDVALYPPARQGRIISSIVRGSAFITARYDNLTPRISSAVMFRQVNIVASSATTQKWRLLLENGTIWLLYAVGGSILELDQTSNQELVARHVWSGIVQVIKMPQGDGAVERLFDLVAGTYPTSIRLTGRLGTRACYEFTMEKVGVQQVLMYALPHHINSFTDEMSRKVYANHMVSQTNGQMTLVWADRWLMQEALPETTYLAACPAPKTRSYQLIESILQMDDKQDFEGQIRRDSMYFCGKALNKLAQITILARQLGSSTYQNLLDRLEGNLMFFVKNQQQYPLVYENTWGGVVSCQGFTERGDGADFGNTWYNDHHYHYGYHISSAALYLMLKPDSSHRQQIEAWTKSLIRDVASPQSDAYFCAYRSMDWFVGHSWSKGLYESADGKDEESSSEDYHFTYAMYLFAQVAGDQAMLDRAMIQLAVQRHSINTYMLFAPDNQVMPEKLVRNCVSGIKFENKIDYTTYFGANKEFIHGIHILPVTPMTSFFRMLNQLRCMTLLRQLGSEKFVRNEWMKKTRSLAVSQSNMQQGWRGLLFASIGLHEGEGRLEISVTHPLTVIGGEAWQYFLRGEKCDDGVCRSWLMAMLSAASA